MTVKDICLYAPVNKEEKDMNEKAGYTLPLNVCEIANVYEDDDNVEMVDVVWLRSDTWDGNWRPW